MAMTTNRAAQVEEIMEHIRNGANDVLYRVGRIQSADDMSTDEFKALAKEVEEVGELVHQLERANSHIIPALFEVPHGKWEGWSGLENFRNMLAHDFRRIIPKVVFDLVKTRLQLREVADLLEAITSVGMMTQSLDFGSRSMIMSLPQSPERADLLPGSSVIVLRFHETGELMVTRSWRDENDNWRASIRWVRTQTEDEDHIVLGIRDTEMVLIPRPTSPGADGNENAYNLLSVPAQSFSWCPETLKQCDTSLTRKKRFRVAPT